MLFDVSQVHELPEDDQRVRALDRRAPHSQSGTVIEAEKRIAEQKHKLTQLREHTDAYTDQVQIIRRLERDLAHARKASTEDVEDYSWTWPPAGISAQPAFPYNMRDVARNLGVSAKTIKRRINDGTFDAVPHRAYGKRGSPELRFDQEWLEQAHEQMRRWRAAHN